MDKLVGCEGRQFTVHGSDDATTFPLNGCMTIEPGTTGTFQIVNQGLCALTNGYVTLDVADAYAQKTGLSGFSLSFQNTGGSGKQKGSSADFFLMIYQLNNGYNFGEMDPISQTGKPSQGTVTLEAKLIAAPSPCQEPSSCQCVTPCMGPNNQNRIQCYQNGNPTMPCDNGIHYCSSGIYCDTINLVSLDFDDPNNTWNQMCGGNCPDKGEVSKNLSFLRGE